MSGGHGNGGNEVMKDLGIILLIFLALFAIWYATGGPARIKKTGENPFTTPIEYDSYGPIKLNDGFVDPN